MKRPNRHNPEPLRLALISALLSTSVTVAFGMQGRQMQPLGNENPIYIADSPIASDSLLRANELLAQRNLDEAVRLCDEIIRDHGHRLMRVDPEHADAVHVPVRERVHDFLLANRELLDTYRRQLTPRARVWLDDEGEWERAVDLAWLTEPGLIASLRQAQVLIEAGRFHTGLATLDQLALHPDGPAHAERIDAMRALANRFIGATPPARNTTERTRSLVWSSTTQPGVNLEGIVPGVLAQSALTPITQMELSSTRANMRMSGASWKPTAWCAPIVEGAHLFTNDGYTISCFDRFTLRPIWRVQTKDLNDEIPSTPDARARLGRIIEDATSISSDGRGAIYTSSGIPRNGDPQGDATLLKLDRDTGRTIWSIQIDSLDPTLTGASIRGPVIVDQGTIVVMAPDEQPTPAPHQPLPARHRQRHGQHEVAPTARFRRLAPVPADGAARAHTDRAQRCGLLQ